MRSLPPTLFLCALLLVPLGTTLGCGARPAPTQPREGEKPPPPEFESRARQQAPGPVFRLKGPAPGDAPAEGTDTSGEDGDPERDSE